VKIIVVGPHFPDSFARNIAVTLETMGHAVTCAGVRHGLHCMGRLRRLFWINAPKLFPSLEIARHNQIIHAAEDFQPDLVLVTTAAFPPQLVRRLQSVSAAQVVCWYTDPTANLHRLYLLASAYDAIFTKEPALVTTLRDKLGRNAHYLPEACNPLWHKRVEITEEQRSSFACDIAGIGTLHYYRARMLEPFVGYDLKIWGNNCPLWMDSPAKQAYANVFLAENAKAAALRCAKIVINTINPLEVDGVNCTLFETAGCGAFQIADWKPALPELFVPEREVVTFRTRSELKEKVDYYLRHPDEREAIAARAEERAHRDHSYEARFQTMFQILGLNPAPGQPATCERMIPVST
jgi:spore maturation protein CgeB